LPIASSVSVVDGRTDTKLGDIPVGTGPLPSIAVLSVPFMQKVYVANSFGGGVSVIKTCLYCARSTLYQTKQVIPIRGEATSIAVDTELPSPVVYVTNSVAGNVSVITGDTNTKLRDIHVGGRPISIAVNENTHAVYVANPSAGNVSVISVPPNYRNGVYVYAPKLAKDIPFGGPLGMAGTYQSIPISIPQSLSGAISTTDIDTTPITVNQDTNAVYVGSARSDSLTIIDGVTKKVVAGVTLDINPSNSGRIICDTKED